MTKPSGLREVTGKWEGWDLTFEVTRDEVYIKGESVTKGKHEAIRGYATCNQGYPEGEFTVLPSQNRISWKAFR